MADYVIIQWMKDTARKNEDRMEHCEEIDMKIWRKLGIAAKYMPFLMFLGGLIFSLCRGISGRSGLERVVWIWKEALLINVLIGMIGSMISLDILGKTVFGRAQNYVDDFVKQSGKDLAVPYNGIHGATFNMVVFMVLITLYIVTDAHWLMTTAYILIYAMAIGTAITIFAHYLEGKEIKDKSLFFRIMHPAFLPVVLWMVMMLVTNTTSVGFVINNIKEPQSTFAQISSLVFVLLYALAVFYCHFSNIYCLLGFAFSNKQQSKVEEKIKAVNKKNSEREEFLQLITEYVDTKAPNVGWMKRLGLAVFFEYSHVKAYYQERWYAIEYLWLLGCQKICVWLENLLDEERIKISAIRFCEIVVVIELLVLDMFLFVYIGSENPCSRFFEVLSTVIIIPIILSSFANLKSKRRKE